MHGFHPKVPHNTVKIPRIEESDEPANEEEEQAAAKGLSRRLEQIEGMETVKKTVGKNIEAPQQRQTKEFNKRQGITENAAIPVPSSLFEKGDYVLIRELNPNHALKSGGKPGASKLRGTVRGPSRYVSISPASKKYGAIEDSNGNQWDKAFHDMVPYDSGRLVSSYKIQEFPVSTKEAVELERTWQDSALPGLQGPTPRLTRTPTMTKTTTWRTIQIKKPAVREAN